MAYLIFNKDLDNVSGTLCAIAANNTDLNNLNIDLDTIKKEMKLYTKPQKERL